MMTSSYGDSLGVKHPGEKAQPARTTYMVIFTIESDTDLKM